MLMLSKFCVTKILDLLFVALFEKNLLQSVANKENFTNFKAVITKSDTKLLQNVTDITSYTEYITKCDRYYKV